MGGVSLKNGDLTNPYRSCIRVFSICSLFWCQFCFDKGNHLQKADGRIEPLRVCRVDKSLSMPVELHHHRVSFRIIKLSNKRT